MPKLTPVKTPGMPPRGSSSPPSTVSRRESGEAGAEEDVAHVGHVGVGGVGCGDEAAVFVFNLGDEDGAAAADLQRGDFLGEAVDPALGGNHEGGVVGAEGGRTCVGL